jgi:ribosomal protein S18 acetylase RimI-like enzyme
MIALRPVRFEDALPMQALARRLIQDGRGMVQTLADLDDHPVAVEAAMRSWLAHPLSDRLRLVGMAPDGRMAAEGSIKRLGPGLLRHVALLALGIDPDFQGQGLGRRVMQGLLDWAQDPPAAPDGSRLPVGRVELYVRADNERAIGLYHSFGFVEEGRRRRFVRLLDGRYIDDLVLALHLPS